ncbi:MAG: DUF1232 domain-containing protein [Firmicutes bacterium]|nr:DUF1232 domain-containing protein [Bacillota bacterium]
MRFLWFAVLGRRIRAIPSFLKDKTVPMRKKALVVFGLIYLILPVDLIPPVIPVFGFLDDAVLWLFILYYLREELDRYAVPSGSSGKEFRGRDVIDVDFTVNEEEDNENNV